MRILIVEDEHRIANTLKKGLEQESYAVDVAYDGDSGYDLATGEAYDLMILDRLLPGIEGVELCRKLRSENIHTPILMLTAKGQVHDRIEGLDAGADDYLPKPFAFEELLARVRALSRRPKHANSVKLTVGDLVLDTASYVVTREGKQITLSLKEYSLLEYLMRHAGQIISKDRIISHVWDYESDILPNTVEVYIGYLRSKIDRPFKGKPLIHTVRGFGYRISE